MDSVVYFLAGAGIVAISYLLALQLVKGFKAAVLDATKERHNKMVEWVASIGADLTKHTYEYKHEKGLGYAYTTPEIGTYTIKLPSRCKLDDSKFKKKKRGKRG